MKDMDERSSSRYFAKEKGGELNKWTATTERQNQEEREGESGERLKGLENTRQAGIHLRQAERPLCNCVKASFQISITIGESKRLPLAVTPFPVRNSAGERDVSVEPPRKLVFLHSAPGTRLSVVW
ncbi:hypothetical protein KQX54_021798 [Cotesia glomerata]|uniref:Uncharacterized protein n=1 Tax=Cotesia glomerata TaxID=32391 RepID=A0AAV7J7P0_COTGL|nr:hypothetical protein KQX54_021798 [Cotesia glomerata]